MINFERILKQSWHILWNYRVLWLFGLILALTTGGSNTPNVRYSLDAPDFSRTLTDSNNPEWTREFTQEFEENAVPFFLHPEEHITTYVLITIALVLFMLIVGVIAAFVRYPAETAVMRMVDEYEQTGTKLGFRPGWKLGWSRRAFRMWLIDLILGLPVLLFVFLMLGAGLIVYLTVTNSIQSVGIISLVAAVGIAFLGLFIVIIYVIFQSLLRNLIVRSAALDGLGVRASFRNGWEMFKGNWKSVGLMWLVMIGIGIAFGIAAMLLFFLLIPAYLVLLVPAGLVAFIPGLIGFGVTSIFTSSPLTWIIGILVALPFFFLVLFTPLFFISGWFKIYASNVWTLTYREIKATASLSKPAPAADAL